MFLEAIPITSQDYMEGERYKIVLGQQLKKDKNYALDLEFQGELNNQLQGFYKSQYSSSSGETRFVMHIYSHNAYIPILSFILVFLGRGFGVENFQNNRLLHSYQKIESFLKQHWIHIPQLLSFI